MGHGDAPLHASLWHDEPLDLQRRQARALLECHARIPLLTCRTFGGSFFGIHALGGQYNIRNVDLPFKTLPKQGKDGRHYEGWYIGGGVTYGYQWLLSKHWNLEAEIGVGYAYSPYKLYGTCKRCLNKGHRNYVGPTKVGISLVYFP